MLGELVTADGVDYEVVFDGRQSLLGDSPLRRGSCLSANLRQRVESEGTRERRKQQRAQEYFERLFK